MLGVNQLDFINYTTALKGNYRKGVHKLEAILANPTHAAEFAANLGGVSVVLGVPIGKEDKNSEALLSLLLASSVADAAVYTWLGQFYEFTSWDDLLGDAGRCQEMMADPFIWRAMASSGVAVGKSVATLAGLDCGAYADMTAVAASSTAMTAVAASQTAMAAVIANSTALNAVVASQTAMAAVAASQTAMAAVIANSTALNAVVSSSTAMTAVAASQTAMAAVTASPTAMAAIATSSMATAKYAASAASLNPADYDDMTELAASSTAMAAVATSYIAVAAVYGSEVAVNAVKANETAWATLTGASSEVMGKAVAVLAGLNPDSYADMTAVAASSTAMTAVAASSAARTAITNSATAKSALASSPLKTTVTKGNGNSWETRTIRNGMGWLISCYNANSGGEAGSTWYKLDGVQTSQPAGTTNVEKFFTSSLAIYWWSSTSSVTYIPC